MENPSREGTIPFYSPSGSGKKRQALSLHNHTVASQQKLLLVEGMTTYEQFVKISKKNRVVPAVTDHNRTLALPFIKKICEREGWSFIPGVEASTPLGHVIFYGLYDDMIRFPQEFDFKGIQGRDFEDRVWQGVRMMQRAMKTGKYLSNIVHYTDVMNTGIGTHGMPDAVLEMVKAADFVEGWNALNSMKSNWHTYKAAWIFKKQYGKKVVIGSDSHRSDMFDSNYTFFEVEAKDTESVLEAMKRSSPVDIGNVKNVDFKYMKDWVMQRLEKSWRHVEKVLDRPIEGEAKHWYYSLSKSDRAREWAKKIGRYTISHRGGKVESMLEYMGTYGSKAGELGFLRDSPAKDFEKIKREVLKDRQVYISEPAAKMRDFAADPYTHLKGLLYEKPAGRQWSPESAA